MPSADEKYLAIIKSALQVCKKYKPMFGHGREGGYTVSEFQELYQQDAFYTWFGLDSPLVYAAHKAAGGITSLYRQIGMASEHLFRAVLQDQLSLSPEQSIWAYLVPSTRGKSRKLSLDGRISPSEIADRKKRGIVEDWISKSAKKVGLKDRKTRELQGAVFEVRQGYKSKDSKRQNADISNAANAYANNYLPVVVLLSAQIDADIAERYTRAQWLLLTGLISDDQFTSTYGFCKSVLGYDLAAFFERNSAEIRGEVENVIRTLLQPQ